MAYAESDHDEDDAAVEKDSKHLRDVWQRAMERFDSVAIPQRQMRAQSLEARRFVTIPGAMWEGAWGEQFENSPRPEVDKITKSLEKIETDHRQNRLTVDFVPGTGADSETADMLDGVHRADSYYFKAQQARDNAFQEGLRGGFGAWRLTTDYVDPYDPDNDSQRINPGLTIVDADQSVYFDGASKLYDKSDAKWAFVITADPRAEAERKWGAGVPDFEVSKSDYQWDWFTPDVVYTAEYYEIEDTADKLLIFTQEQSGEERRYFETELDDEQRKDLKQSGWKVRTRDIKRRRVYKYVLNGDRVLKNCGPIAGTQIPIVPFYFRRDYVDNMERWRGYVSKMMDRQRIYNASIGAVVETQSLAPAQVPIFDPEQVDSGIAEQWATANIDRAAFRLAKSLRNTDGTIAQAGPVGWVQPTQLQPATVSLLQVASADLAENDDQADQVKANVSADAMDIAAARVDAKSAIPLDNMRQSVAREGEIYLPMAREVYYEEGRKVETLTIDGQDGEATLQEPVLDEQGVYRIRNDLTQGKYKVIADVQESTSTARAKTVKQNMEIAQAATAAQDMELAQAAILNAVVNMSGEGVQDMQAYARNKLISLGVIKPTPDEQKQIEAAQQAQSQGQPSSADQALMAQASKDASIASLNKAKEIDTLASAHLKSAQAEVVGGPEAAPDVPSGLGHVASIADIQDKLAGADLKQAQARKIQHGIGLESVRTASDIHIQHRQQNLAEQAPSRTTGLNG